MQTLTTGEWAARGTKLLMLVLLPGMTAIAVVSWMMRDAASTVSLSELLGATAFCVLLLALPVLAAGLFYLMTVLVLAEFLPRGGAGLPTLCASASAVALLFSVAIAHPGYLTESNPTALWAMVVGLLGLAALAGPVRGYKEGTDAVEREP